MINMTVSLMQQGPMGLTMTSSFSQLINNEEEATDFGAECSKIWKAWSDGFAEEVGDGD